MALIGSPDPHKMTQNGPNRVPGPSKWPKMTQNGHNRVPGPSKVGQK